MTYEQLLIEADNNNLITKEKPLLANKGRIKGNKIAIKRDLTQIEKKCVLAEELGHYYTATGDILDQSTTENRKQERLGRIYSYNRIIGLIGLIRAYKNGCQSIHEAAEYLDVTDEFLLEAINCYKSKYGLYATIDSYVIYFEPISVLELI